MDTLFNFTKRKQKDNYKFLKNKGWILSPQKTSYWKKHELSAQAMNPTETNTRYQILMLKGEMLNTYQMMWHNFSTTQYLKVGPYYLKLFGKS